jgi:hypothetical protein
MFTRVFAGFCTIVLIATTADGRHVELWSYDRLSKSADVVVVATVVSTDAWGDAEEKPQLGGVVFEGQLTKFEVKGVLKGKVTQTTMELVHYRATMVGTALRSGVRVIHTRAYAADFHTAATAAKSGTTRDEGPPHYLLFLKQREDGKFEPVSGQVDSACSVMLLKPEGPVRLHREYDDERLPR